MQGLLEIQNICKSFNHRAKKKVVLDHASMIIKNNSKVALIGKSGCGKTTLLNIIAGLILPDDGKILYNQSSLKSDSRNKERANFRFNYVGYVPQRLCLINEYTVFENIAYFLRLSGLRDYQVLSSKVKPLATRLKIDELLGEKVSSLSAGQCQRVAIARAIITSRPILLADEPTSALDNETKSLVTAELMQYPGTVLIVTHDSDVISSCQETFLLENGQISKILI